MTPIKEIRIRLNLSQKVMAQYLGIARSRLASAETEGCRLKTSAALKLAELEARFHKVNTCTAESKCDQPDESLNTYYNKRLDNARLSKIKLHKKLDAMNRHFGEITNDQINNFLNQDANLQPLALFQKKRIERRMQSCNASARKITELKIYLLQEEILALERYLIS